ncbi:fatty acid synthase-like [Cylas formicarius]|uniref:fatty acid synthase-like n=1 Tax=Cylas formicarius TaxID=197179 RepID=UPI002958545F|nr:fatty acid synthase-like [Cylas formicarius]
MIQEDEIVISGIAGRYPECDSFNEFKEALLAGKDLLTVDDRRFPPGTYNTPPRTGKINNIDRFDAGFFGINPKQADLTDPRQRIMLETAFEAIVDSGYNPKELRGSKTGVYVGIGQFDNGQGFKDVEKTNGYTMIGYCLGQVANRTSYHFDLKGPSYALDTACSSGFYAMVNAFKAIESGEIDAALVSSVHINFHPHEAMEFTSLNMMSPDGKCKVFGVGRDGYGRSEAIVTMFLQRKSRCRRMYSTILGGQTNSDGFKIEGLTYPSSQMQLKLMQDIYSSKVIKPGDVSYIEMHGTGTPAGDLEECKAVTEFFCRDRHSPIPVGAVKTNMGHSEISSGLCSITKVLVAMETGVIPANIHTDNIDDTLPGIGSGQLKVVTQNIPWEGGVVALNCFGFGGANAHLVLKSNPKRKSLLKPSNQRLVNVSGRTEEGLHYMLDEIEKQKDDAEFLALLDEIHKIDVEGHNYRGYAVLSDNPVRQVNKIGKERRQVWFIYTGMGCQWASMGKDLMKFDVFRNTLTRCGAVLKPYGVDLEHIVTSDDSTIFDNIVNCFAGISSMQVALTDLIKSFGIEPDAFAGHSLGEVGCAYCDGEITAEQAALIGFARGYAANQSKTGFGLMAAVGLSKEECSKMLPEGTCIACVNSNSSVTVSGPMEIIETFVQKLTEVGIFAKLVKSGGYAFHSKYMLDVGPILLEFLKGVLKDPKPRSGRWISSSWPEKDWDKPQAKMNDAFYHYNNYSNTVLFNQVLGKIPSDAVVIEVSPHGLLQSILKRELGPNISYISLADRNSQDNEQFFLSAIGKFYINGGQANLRQVYDEIKFPVGKGTSNIGSLIKWEHSAKWFAPLFKVKDHFGKEIRINTSESEYSYLEGHNIDGRVLMPATGYLEMIWRVLANMHLKTFEKFPVVFENVKFSRATVLPTNQDVTFLINFMKQSGYFEIFEGGSVCCSGKIHYSKNTSTEFTDLHKPTIFSNGYLPLNTQDIYKFLHMNRYLYRGFFRGIKEIDVLGYTGKLHWNKSFTSFMDTMLQVSLLSETSSDLLLPSRIQKIVIDPLNHAQCVDEESDISVFFDKDLRIIKSGAIEIVNMEPTRAPKRHVKDDAVLESFTFEPYDTVTTKNEINLEQSLSIVFQIIIELEPILNFTFGEIVSASENSFRDKVEEVLMLQPLVTLDFVKDKLKKVDFLIFTSPCTDKSLLGNLKEGGFVLFHGFEEDVASFGMTLLYCNSCKARGLFLLRKVKEGVAYSLVKVSNQFDWIEEAKSIIKANRKEVIYLYSQNDDLSGILGLVKCLIREPLGNVKIQCVFIKDKNAEPFNPNSEFYRKQLSRNLTFNVLWKGVWGSYRHLPIHRMKQIDVSHASNLIQTVGDLSTFSWTERPSYYYKYFSSSELTYVVYSALNFKDVMVSTGKISNPPSKDPTAPNLSVGLEFSGITESGKRVMGIVPGNSIGLQVMTDPLFTWEVPNSWKLEEAATVPVVYATCYYAMIMRGQMRPNESILIHAGTGGVGLAAISIALSMNCEVYTTVGTPEKREYLAKMFPDLKIQNIGNSRNSSFELMVKRNTQGKGVDLVLNSLSADLYHASLRCLGRRGRFLEIGKVDLQEGTPMNANLFGRNNSFHAVFLDDLFSEDCYLKVEVQKLLREGIVKGVVRPLPSTVFSEHKVEDAYRYLATGKHKGKILIKIRDEKQMNLHRTIQAIPKIYFDHKKTFIIIGGLGGVGLELVSFLISRNAKKIVLNSRRGISNGYQSLCLKRWSEIDGVTVRLNIDDSTTIQGTEALVKFAESMGPVGGVFNMALVLEDGAFVNQTANKYSSVFKSKFVSGSNMDAVTRKSCPQLEHFVVFSSLACGRGNPGQTNYAMANSALERLCEQRREDGLPALAVQWGVIGEVGAVAEVSSYQKVLDVMGIESQTVSSCMNSLEIFMLQPSVICASFLRKDRTSKSEEAEGKTLAETIVHILGIKNIESVDKNVSLAQIGLDSLMVAEIKQTIYRNFNIELTSEEIRDLTVNKINSLLQEKNQPAEDIAGSEVGTINAMLSSQPILEIINDKSFTKKVFLLHPIEGHVEAMIPLARILKANVYGLQCTRESPIDDLKGYARDITHHIKKIQSQGPYSLCGYSFGGAVAFEVGVQLEMHGDRVQIFFLDGTPSFVRKTLETYSEKRDRRTKVLQGFLHTFHGVDQEKIGDLSDESHSWQQMLSLVGKLVADTTKYDPRDVEVAADRFFNRIKAAYYYEPDAFFDGSATLIRADNKTLEAPIDYDLQKICSKPIKLLQLPGDHKQILLGQNLSKIAEVINSSLE